MTDMTVANTILDQLGGKQFLVVTGSNGMVGGKNSLTMFVPGTKHRGKVKVTVELTPLDLYTVTVGRIKGFEWEEIEKRDMVYCDMLMDTFEELTGVYCTLYPRK